MIPRKRDLRKQIEAAIADLSADDVAAASKAVCDRLLDEDAVRRATHLAVYAAFGREIDLSRVARDRHAAGTVLCYPRFNRAQKLYEMVPIADPVSDLQPGHWGLLEPRPDLPPLSDRIRIDQLAWLIPGVAFDPSGNRLGRGGGYYDRMLKDTLGARIGVGCDCQLVPTVPADSHDQYVNLVITDRRRVVCRPMETIQAKEIDR